MQTRSNLFKQYPQITSSFASIRYCTDDTYFFNLDATLL